ncbi:MAG: hypothetical protein E3K36_04470 [Candidatus Brocadia sp.]|nr:hypothetical protein [Candidatus Brocadia sp.]
MTFIEYWLTYAGSGSQPVYALTTGHLFYFHNEKSFGDLLGGAKPNPGEEILILKPLNAVKISWRASHPGSKPLLEECVYLSVQMLDDNALEELIKKTATEDFFKTQYKTKTGTEWQGTGDWVSEYLQKFKEYSDWPIIVKGGAQIASTRDSPDTTQEQRVSMFFKVGGQWDAHDDAVRTFFKYHQRRSRLSGHPLIARLLGRSVKSGTVDVIPSSVDPDGSIEYIKDKLIEDFMYFASNPTETETIYHPLALDPDEDPHRLIVPKAPTSAIPPYLVPSLGPDHWVTKLKVSNPLGLTIQIVHESAAVNVFLVPSSTTEQVVQFSATPNSPGETIVNIIAGETGETICDLNLTFLDFHAVPVKFYKLIDTSYSNYQTDMDEPKLREVVAYANEILGRQTNVYIYPVEESGVILHDHHVGGLLGDPITSLEAVIIDFFLLNQFKNINVVFVWNLETAGTAETLGVCYAWEEADIAAIMIDTKHPNYVTNVPALAKTLVHELGHWFSDVFIFFPNRKAGLPLCSGSHIHFKHGCPGGDWGFYSNMMYVGRNGLFITLNQTEVFNGHADDVLP